MLSMCCEFLSHLPCSQAKKTKCLIFKMDSRVREKMKLWLWFLPSVIGPHILKVIVISTTDIKQAKKHNYRDAYLFIIVTCKSSWSVCCIFFCLFCFFFVKSLVCRVGMQPVVSSAVLMIFSIPRYTTVTSQHPLSKPLFPSPWHQPPGNSLQAIDVTAVWRQSAPVSI